MGKLFVLLGGNTTDFLCFDPTIGTSGVWKGASSAPATVEAGGRLVYPGSGNYIYACRGQSTSTIWQYSISADAWDTTTPDLPVPTESTAGYEARMWSASNMFWPGTGDYIYAAMTYYCYNKSNITNYQTFWRLGPLSGTPAWERLADCPRYTDNKGFILYDPDGAGTEIQLLSGNNYTNPWHYNIAKNRWKELTQPLWNSSSSGRDIYWVKNHTHSDIVLGSDGFDYICILDHTSSNQTKPVTGASWETYWRRLNPYDTKSWATGTVYAEGDIITGTDSLDYRCIRRHLSADTNKPITGASYSTYWQTPAVTTRGSAWINAKAYVSGPYDDYLYWWGGYYNYNFWRYKISTDTWERLADLPWSGSYSGANMTDIGDGYLYFHRGNNGYNFARYNMATDVWETLTDSPNSAGFVYGFGVIGVISKADRVLGSDGLGYICKKRHVSSTLNKPISGANWAKYWELNGSTTDCVTWVESKDYGPGLENIKPSIVVGTDGNDYRCIKNHISATSSCPITGTTSTWQTYWVATGTTGQGDTWASGTMYNSRTGTVGHYKFIFGFPGYSTSYWYRYDPIDNTWLTCENVITSIYGGEATWTGLNAPDKGRYIYLERGHGGTYFYRYDIEMDGWVRKTDSFIPTYYHYSAGGLANDGSSQYIYHLSGYYETPYDYRLERYDTSTDSWSEFASLPFCSIYRAVCQTPDAIWASPYYGNDQLMKYDLTKPTHNQPGIWEERVYDTCYSSYADGNIAVDSNGYNYMIFGDMYYYTNSNIWIFDTNAKQSKIVGSDGADYDCILSHTSSADNYPTTGANWTTYWQTSRSTGKGVIWTDSTGYYCSKHANRWSGLIRAPFYLGPGTKGQYMANENSIYFLEGKNTKYVWQYDITNDRWLRAKDTLTVVNRGSELTGGCGVNISGHESPRDVLFCLGGNGATQFNLYFVEPGYDYWTSYLSALDGHSYRGTNSMTYSSYDNRVYKLRTEITSTCYVYNP
ncbi:MAG: hypothetical protein WC300_06320, partial [Candidatus Omnitrophota bacterium]